jgi:hypothetical protein
MNSNSSASDAGIFIESAEAELSCSEAASSVLSDDSILAESVWGVSAVEELSFAFAVFSLVLSDAPELSVASPNVPELLLSAVALLQAVALSIRDAIMVADNRNPNCFFIMIIPPLSLNFIIILNTNLL